MLLRCAYLCAITLMASMEFLVCRVTLYNDLYAGPTSKFAKANFLPGFCLHAGVQWFPPSCLEQHCLETKPNQHSFPSLTSNPTPKASEKCAGGGTPLCLSSHMAAGCSGLITCDLGDIQINFNEKNDSYPSKYLTCGILTTVSQDLKAYRCSKCRHRN